MICALPEYFALTRGAAGILLIGMYTSAKEELGIANSETPCVESDALALKRDNHLFSEKIVPPFCARTLFAWKSAAESHNPDATSRTKREQR